MKQLQRTFTRRNIILMNYGILLLMVVAGFTYAFNLNATVMNVVERRQVERNIAELSTQIAEREYEYTAIKNSIEIDRAARFGLGEAQEVVFVTRIPISEGLTVNTLSQ